MIKIQTVENVMEVPFDELSDQGIKHVVCDVESTLVPFDDDHIEIDVINYIDRARALGHIASFSLFTDKQNDSFVRSVSDQLGGVPYYMPASWHEFKPNPKNLHKALKNAAAQPSEAVIIGDRFTSEILAGFIAKVDRAYWVSPLGTADHWDNKYIWRPLEKPIRRLIKR